MIISDGRITLTIEDMVSGFVAAQVQEKNFNFKEVTYAVPALTGIYMRAWQVTRYWFDSLHIRHTSRTIIVGTVLDQLWYAGHTIRALPRFCSKSHQKALFAGMFMLVMTLLQQFVDKKLCPFQYVLFFSN